ncbi:hypothetical protein DFH09DRAFT_1138504 [Mycena vulgaris]|nr:hypothetical protein DFH09DRAFT_1138504 [Mycena vulgaris]
MLELETGEVRVASGADCSSDGGPGDSFDEMRDVDDDYELGDELDLDALDGTARPISKPTQVLIGRTEYRVRVHTGAANETQRSPIVDLYFSTYGPSDQDNGLQASYRDTKDGMYIQSLPDGEIISFKARGEAKEDSGSESVRWAYKFSEPVCVHVPYRIAVTELYLPF